MKKLLKYLKPYKFQIGIIFFILLIQAYCELSLPSYTSDIVNVGIQQGGIDEKVPEKIGASDYDELMLFVDSDGQEQLKDAYKKEDDCYVLELDEKDEAYEQLAQKMAEPMMMALVIEEQGVPKEQIPMVIGMIKEQTAKMPETMMQQASVSYIKKAYEHIGEDTEKIQNQYILKTGGKMLALAFLAMMASVLVGLLSARVAAGNGRRLRSAVFKKVVGFSNAEMDHFSTASLITRSTNDIQQIQMLTVMLLRMVMFSPILAVGGVIKVFHTNVDMSWIIALGVGLIIMLVAILFIVAMPKFRILQELVDRLNLVTREILTGLPVIRAFSTEKHEEERFDQANTKLIKTNLFVNRTMTFMMPLMMLIMNGITVLIVWNGASGIDAGKMQVGDMMAFIQYTMQIIMSFLMICMISIMLPRAAVAADRVDEVLNSESIIKDLESPKSLKDDLEGVVEFKNVDFKYPGAEENVLSEIDFVARPGQTTAIIGSTGCGKSTLVNLIPRFYDVTGGNILVDGIDIRELDRAQLRSKIGYVPQKGVLFSGTIESNILFRDDQLSEEAMEEAAKIAQAYTFIQDKPKKFQSSISQGGGNVSGGQKQRLSIARAIAGNPKILIFDDSFSALDYKTDVALRNELQKKIKDSTVLIVAQRISTILHADQIIVLDEGKIAGIGTHKELLRTCDAYYQIASSQLSEEELKADLEDSRKEDIHE